MKVTKAIRNKPLQCVAAFVISLALIGIAQLLTNERPTAAAGLATKQASFLPVPQDAVTEWNQIAVAKVLASGLPPPRQLRAMAIVQVSVNEAVNGLTRNYQTYLDAAPAPDGASVDGAAVAAAYTALVGIFPTQQAALNALYLNSLANRQIATDDAGVGYGVNAANAVLANRATDGNAAAGCPYTDLAPDPGVWQRVINPAVGTFPPAAVPCFGNVRPWVLRSSSQFLIDAPPALGSDQYAKEFNETKSLGELNSVTRTTEQTAIADFWNGSPTDIWNQALLQVTAANEMDISSEARAFALVYMAGTDAAIACWWSKYNFHFWRPVTAINRADEDGNPATETQIGWTSYLQQWMHQHPEYPSGHSTNSSALGSEMALLFGDKPGITMTPTITGITREWDSFDQAVDEVIDARIYSGIHFRSSTTNGARLGRQVAQFVFSHALRPCVSKRGRCS